MYDVIIIGGGSTAFSAAMYAGRLNMKTLVLCEQLGGTLSWAGSIENWPGIEKIDGFDLVMNIKNHALSYGVKLVEQQVDKVEKTGNSFICHTGKEKFEGQSIIIATGTKLRKLGVPGEKEFSGQGVHYCALCDGHFYRGKTVGIVGGSDSAAKEALILAEFAEKVYIIYRGEKIRPEPINAERVKANKKIEVITNTNITEIKGEKTVTSVKLDNPHEGMEELKLEGLFIAIGHIPLSEMFESLGVRTNPKKEIIIDRDAKTSVEGVYAAGDVVDTSFKQAITGAGEAVLAAHSAYEYVSERKIKSWQD